VVTTAAATSMSDSGGKKTTSFPLFGPIPFDASLALIALRGVPAHHAPVPEWMIRHGCASLCPRPSDGMTLMERVNGKSLPQQRDDCPSCQAYYFQQTSRALLACMKCLPSH
jgi:hypothetical protein